MRGMAKLVRRLWFTSSLLAAVGAAAASDLVFIIDASTEMPWARLQNKQVTGGLHRDLALALGAQLGRDAKLLVLPRKRLASAIERGEADIVCGLRPEWFAGPFDWSVPVLPDGELIMSLASARRPTTLTDLRGQAIGTVSGFAYPELEQALGEGFVREDAPNAEANLRKLNRGRMQYAVANQLYADYQRRQGAIKVALHPDYMLTQYVTPCALSRRSQVKLSELNQAIVSLKKAGALNRMIDTYR